ncbi:MAG: L-seryl-tRNA(Sec) selenium transferase, partial [Chloroflexota bacterium]
MTDTTIWFRQLPSVDRLLKERRAEDLAERYPRDQVVQALRESLEEARAGI